MSTTTSQSGQGGGLGGPPGDPPKGPPKRKLPSDRADTPVEKKARKQREKAGKTGGYWDEMEEALLME
jgi:hypothetical protein